MVVPADPIRNHAAGVLQSLEPVAVHALVLSVRITRSTIPFCSGLYGVMYSCCRP